MKRMLHVFIQALRFNASGFLSVFNPSSRCPALPAVFRATIFFAAFIPTGSASPATGRTAAFNPAKNIITAITLGDSPVVCQGATSANLPYTELNGSPLPDEYTIDYDAAAEAAGFADVAYTALPLSPIPFPLPVRYHIHYGEPIALHEGLSPQDADDPDVAARATAKVQAAVQALVDKGLRERKGVFV